MSVYEMAGLRVAMSPKHPLTAQRAERYLSNDARVDMTVVGNGDANEEYATLAQSFYTQLLLFDGFLLHASAVELNGEAFAFSAPSGTGKSTHARYWRSELSAQIINDDKPAIRRIDDRFCACGTPFSGKHDDSRNVCVPLKAIVFLRRAEQVQVRRLSMREALYALLNQTVRPNNVSDYDRLLSLLEDMLSLVDVFEAGVPNRPNAAREVYRAVIAKA